MSHLKSKFIDSRLGLSLLGILFSLALPNLAKPSLAHTVKASGDVAATFHLEPSHNPKAGEISHVWFALTKVGGEVIPLQNCDCQLSVKQAEKTIDQPPLKAINAEQYQGIPGSEIIFPSVGIYTLEISGKPKTGEDFKPFQLNYEVTVQPGQSPASAPPSDRAVSSSAPSTLESQNRANLVQPAINPTHWLIGGTIGLIALAIVMLKKRNS